MIKTLDQATEFVAKSIHNIDPENEDMEPMVIRELLEDRFYEKVDTSKLTPEDMENLDEKIDDETYIDTHLQWKIPNYYTKLEETVKEVLSEYLMELQAK